jgi:hypothetical protein
MIEPITLTVEELAGRWNRTSRQILEYALHRFLPIYFPFDGLVFDVVDEWHRSNGDWEETRERGTLKQSIDAIEAQLQRHALHQRGQLNLPQWEQVLTSDEVKELRAKVDAQNLKHRRLSELLDRREIERKSYSRNGLLRAAPATLQAVAERGNQPFPRFAYLPDKPVFLAPAPDGNGQVLDGHLVALEDARSPKERLTVNDLFVAMGDVREIEQGSPSADEADIADSAKPSTPHQQTAPEATAPGTVPGKGAGQVAIKVAWMLECELGQRPTATEVMTRLREFANDGTEYAEVLRQTPATTQGVNWITKKGKATNYSAEALGSALTRWWNSRQ